MAGAEAECADAGGPALQERGCSCPGTAQVATHCDSLNRRKSPRSMDSSAPYGWAVTEASFHCPHAPPKLYSSLLTAVDTQWLLPCPSIDWSSG